MVVAAPVGVGDPTPALAPLPVSRDRRVRFPGEESRSSEDREFQAQILLITQKPLKTQQNPGRIQARLKIQVECNGSEQRHAQKKRV